MLPVACIRSIDVFHLVSSHFPLYNIIRIMQNTNNKPSLYLLMGVLSGILGPLFIFLSRCTTNRLSFFLSLLSLLALHNAVRGDQLSIMCFFTGVLGTHTIVLVQINSWVSRGGPFLFSGDNMLSLGIAAVLIGLLRLLKHNKDDENRNKLECCDEENEPFYLLFDDENDNDDRSLERRRIPYGHDTNSTIHGRHDPHLYVCIL